MNFNYNYKASNKKKIEEFLSIHVEASYFILYFDGTKGLVIFLKEFKPMESALDNSFLSSNQDTNWFLV